MNKFSIFDYVTDEGFDFIELINDDFFFAIKGCFNAGHYVSCAKLLVCFIDAMGFVYCGDDRGNSFKLWCNAFVDLGAVGISADELWEHRNALVHTSTLHSRRTRSGSVPMLISYVGVLPPGAAAPDGEKWFSMKALIEAVAEGVRRFGSEFVYQNPETFLLRYEAILSDRRVLRMELSPGQ